MMRSIIHAIVDEDDPRHVCVDRCVRAHDTIALRQRQGCVACGVDAAESCIKIDSCMNIVHHSAIGIPKNSRAASACLKSAELHGCRLAAQACFFFFIPSGRFAKDMDPKAGFGFRQMFFSKPRLDRSQRRKSEIDVERVW